MKPALIQILARGLIALSSLCVLLACSSEPAPLQGGTGVDSGGGNSAMPGKFSKEQFDQFVRHDLKPVLRLVFDTIEFEKDHDDTSLIGRIVEEDPENQKIIASLRKKLFSDSAIFKRLETAELRGQEGACKNPASNEDADGSASAKENIVCLSYGRLGPKLSTEEYALSIVALAAHEYAHLVGSTEKESERLQEEIVQSIRLGNRSGNLIKYLATGTYATVYQISKSVDLALEDIARAEVAKSDFDGGACSNLYGIDILQVIWNTKRNDIYWIFGVFVGGRRATDLREAFQKDRMRLWDACYNFSFDPKVMSREDLKQVFMRMKENITAIHALREPL